MGLNISGLVIDKNYEENLTELASIIGQKLVFEREVLFEEALESWKEDSYCDVYFSNNGTFVLLSMELGGFDFYAENQTAFSFVFSEMTMMFTVNYTKSNELLRYKMESDEINEDEGEPLDFEKDEKDTEGLIYHLLGKTLGESFDDIDLEAKCIRYTFREMEGDDSNQSEKRKIEKESSSKPWWKFWN